MVEIKVADIIKTKNAILHEFGAKVYDIVSSHLKEGQKVTISFEGLKYVTSGFANSSIGNLYKNFKKADALITIKGIEGNPLWREKINDAIHLASRPDLIERQNKAISELLSS